MMSAFVKCSRAASEAAGYVRFLRNVLIAAGNSCDRALIPLIVTHLRHPEPLVRGMAVWALSELATADQLQAMAADYLSDETDKTVVAEWTYTCTRA